MIVHQHYSENLCCETPVDCVLIMRQILKSLFYCSRWALASKVNGLLDISAVIL